MQGRVRSNKAGQQIKRVRNIRLTLAFDGTDYSGWQVQEGRPTVQGALRAAIERIAGEKVSLIGSGRTDAGTHARALVANFRTCRSLDARAWLRALNALLPQNIRVLAAARVRRDFHARNDASSKVYRYQIFRGAVIPPHLAREHYHYSRALDLEIMIRAAAMFPGEHDFASFAARSGAAQMSRNDPGRGTVRRILKAELTAVGRRLLFTVEGDGFLHHMVRNMAGTLLEIGRGRMSLEKFRELFSRRDRALAGFTAPAHGLILLRVRYRGQRRRGI